MSLRRSDLIGLVAGAAIGAALVPEALHGDPARLLSTFLGVASVGIFPSITLLIGSMSAGDRSIYGLDRLRNELNDGVESLLWLLTYIGIVFAAVFMLSLTPPVGLTHIPYLTTEILPRLGQSVVVGGAIAIIVRVSIIPRVLKRTLTIKYEIAAENARKKTSENVIAVGEPNALFPTDPDFGRMINLAQVRES